MKGSLPMELMTVLETRFESNMTRHPDLAWCDVLARLRAHPDKVRSLGEMERTGGEPDVVAFDQASGEFVYFDCSPESPLGRRSICYDREGLESRKEHRPPTSAADLAAEMGIALLSEEQYRQLQALGRFDAKTSSWLFTPPEIRKLGGAIFGDFRFGRVFVYHNGAQSYYGGRGFRGVLRV